MSKGKTVFIVEGEDKEPDIFEWVNRKFFNNSAVNIVLPAARNILALFTDIHSMFRRGEDIDIIEYLRMSVADNLKPQFDGISRANFSEIFMFFDFDIQGADGHFVRHENRLGEMLKIFSDETGYGKLYVSYPMMESLYSWEEGVCNVNTECSIPFEKSKPYKEDSLSENMRQDLSAYSDSDWSGLLNNFLMRTQCLFGPENVIDRARYKKTVTPETVFVRQKEQYFERSRIFILNAIPEFLLAYSKKEVWTRHISCTAINHGVCEKERSDVGAM